ncbi:MAG: TIGR02186 family protein [Alphaproteobacteria bacterium]|nr:TIGR02186 family protein [Alphaproteobacteria bacterium]
MIARMAVLALALSLAAAPASAQRLAGALSEYQVSVTSDFVGQTLTLFGNVEPPIGAADELVEGPFQVIVLVTGPPQDRVVRQQTNRHLIWLNTQSETFRSIPSYKWVFSSAPLPVIANDVVLESNRILFTSLGAVDPDDTDNSRLFRAQLVRLMMEKGLYGIDETGVQFRSSTLYSVKIALPGDVPNGTFLAETFLFRNNALVARKGESFIVRKVGLERLVGDTARDNPLLYGLTCVALALTTGWLGGVIFRR